VCNNIPTPHRTPDTPSLVRLLVQVLVPSFYRGGKGGHATF
jgi:hypothetical protein